MRTLASALLALSLLLASPIYAEEAVESAGKAVGMTAGNMWFVPIKAISLLIGASAGALSYVVTGGNEEITSQLWENTLEGPYLITPDVAERAVGDRPEVELR